MQLQPKPPKNQNSTFPRLLGDIGGTNARFAWQTQPNEAPAEIEVLPCSGFASLQAAMQDYLSRRNGVPQWCGLGIAAPLLGDAVRMTNHHWTFSQRELRQEFKLDRLLLVNDFTALALGVPALQPHERLPIGAGQPEPGPIAVLGPGTGLGVSGLLPVLQGKLLRYLPLTGEGGHVTLAASNPHEAEVIGWLWRQYPHVSAERLLSGPGLVLLYQAIAAVAGYDVPTVTTARDVTEAARHQKNAASIETLQMFCALLGTVAADLVLTLGARGGVFLGGGVTREIQDALPTSPFRERFETKGRRSDYLAFIPTWVIQAPFAALSGVARALELDPGWLSVSGAD